MLKAYLIGLFCFILFLTIHVVIFRRLKIEERFNALVKIFFSLFPAYTLLYFLIPYDLVAVIPAEPIKYYLPVWWVKALSSAINFFGGLMLYVFLFLGYCQFYFIVDRSISVRIMTELENVPEKRLSYKGIKEVYNFDEILSRRLKHMVDSKYLVKNLGYYMNTKKGKFEAKVFKFLKEFLNLGKGG